MGDQEILLKPGQQIKPCVTNEDVLRLVHQLYNLEVSSVKELNSYDDRNYHIKVKDDSVLSDDDVCQHGYILKILNSLDSKAESLIHAQNEMMLFLRKKGISCPKPVQNIENKLLSFVKLNSPVDCKDNNETSPASKEKHIVRLLTFIPGEILYTVEYTKDLLYQVGEMAAKTDLALMDFHHEGLLGVERIWNLNAVPKLKEFVPAVPDEARRALALKVIENFEAQVVPQYGTLAAGAIHGDLNEQNILVQGNSNKPGTCNISGIIDFGDIHHNFYVFELAIATCYMMIECKSMDVLDAPGHVLAGYSRSRPIPDNEFYLLKSCIAGRFCQSLVLGAYSYSQTPDPYVLTTSKRGWHCLEQLWNCPQDVLYQRWRQIIETYSNNNAQ